MMDEYQWVDLGGGRKVYRKVPEPIQTRSHLPAPYTRADGMSAVQNPCDGKFYESRSQYERAVKAAGAEIVGDDKGHWDRKPPAYEPKGVKEDIVAAMKQQGAL